MIIVMRKGHSVDELTGVVKFLETLGLRAHISEGEEKTIIGAVGDERLIERDKLLDLNGVETAIPILKPYKLASREFKPESTIIGLNGTKIGNGRVVVMAGPCAVESYDQVLETAISAKQAGAKVLRGGAFKPRSSPYSFQGLGRAGLEILARVRDQVGLPIVTECLSQDDVAIVSEHADIIQIGARNMQNFAMLEKVGKQPRPVLLKRGMMSTVEELLMSAEYILANGNYNVILCERGIRTFDTMTRNTSDIAAVPLLKSLTHLPVIVDPSHATGDRKLVPPLSLAAIAAGADGLIVEIHPTPDTAMCDGHQSLNLPQFSALMDQVRAIAQVVGKTL
ncbi:MAG: 3-deoxy-7-phosphoheptulonate synthase [candidate division Zixibacteria bacterium]|nr:3-deoxy-7-phosphoheptulonate synthase [candidate division Zixibacteria bacterium]